MPTSNDNDPRGASGQLRQAAGRYQALLDAIDQGFCVIEMIFAAGNRPVDYRLLEVNAAFERQAALADPQGRTIRSLTPVDDDESLDLWLEIYARIAATGRTERFEKPASRSGHAYEVCAFRVGEPADRTVGILFNDISRRKNAEAELQHRVRNTLAITRSIVRRTAASSRTVDDYAGHLEGRIAAIARIESRAAYNAQAGLDLAMLIADELSACAVHENGRLKLTGARFAVSVRAAGTLALAFQELATNAIKFGALTHSRGRIRVSWQVTGEDALRLEWKESGVSSPPQPRRAGFGTDLFERALPYELRASVDVLFEDDGVRCIMLLPLGTVAAGFVPAD